MADTSLTLASLRSRRALLGLSLPFLAGLAAMLAAAWLVYRPGLSGDFLFDDFGNLPALGDSGSIDHWAVFCRYVTSGTADPTGRPLSLLSFLVDARNWPAAPYPFKVTNVLLHLLNGALLCAVLLRLGQAMRMQSAQARLAALFGAAAWLLHPLLVSTTLYVVQREAMLPVTFVLLGILCWIRARDALKDGTPVRAWTGMLLAAWGCTLLAGLSKGNGFLLPLLLLLVEWVVLAPNLPMPERNSERHRRVAIGVLLILPTALLLVWMLIRIPYWSLEAAQIRGWTLGQRLLTEPRAVTEYLRLLWIPRAHSSGLFNDAFLVSTDWLHPASTTPCVILILALIGASILLRSRYPAIALAVLFYFAAQLLESTWPPLELYYEHRNYLPAMLLFWPVAILLFHAGGLRWLRCGCAAAILILLATLTFQRASLWGDGYRQAQIWAAFNPGSARAQASAAQYDMAHGRPRLATARLRNALQDHPDDLQIPLTLIGAECQLGGLRPQTLAAARNALAHARPGGTLSFDWFNDAIDKAQDHQCPGLDYSTVRSLLDVARSNPWWRDGKDWQQTLANLEGRLDLAEGKGQSALLEFNQSLLVQPRQTVALQQAALLGSNGHPELGLAHLDYFHKLHGDSKPGFGMPMIHAWVLAHQRYWQKETVHLRETLRADAAAKLHTPNVTSAPRP
jgi:tetratricopeptide (TPR) repeat protein